MGWLILKEGVNQQSHLDIIQWSIVYLKNIYMCVCIIDYILYIYVCMYMCVCVWVTWLHPMHGLAKAHPYLVNVDVGICHSFSLYDLIRMRDPTCKPAWENQRLWQEGWTVRLDQNDPNGPLLNVPAKCSPGNDASLRLGL